MKRVSFAGIVGLKLSSGGLSSAEVSKRIQVYGKNEILGVHDNRWLSMLKETIRDPMIWFLFFIGTVYFFLQQYREAITLVVAILPLVLMDAFLHWRTQSSTAVLKSQLNKKVEVIRDSQAQLIDTREIVPGDLVYLRMGDYLPADGYWEKTKSLQVDESILTGEAFPLQKNNLPVEELVVNENLELLAPETNLAFAGTRVLTGEGQVRVLLTGLKTCYGDIVHSITKAPHEQTPLQQSISSLVKVLIYVALIFCICLAVIRRIQGDSWLEALMSALTLAVAAIPEEFPVVYSFFLGVGVYRMAKRGALVRRAVAVENIGRVSQICSDKTGTLTLGQLQLTHFDCQKMVSEKALLEVGLGASQKNSFDPLDQALHFEAKKKNIIQVESIQRFPFTEDRKKETAILEIDGEFRAYCKGAPETVFFLCSLTKDEIAEWQQKVSVWAKSGHKVIAFAQKKLTAFSQSEVSEPNSGFELSGLMAFEDPPRPEAKGAINYCLEHNIKVMMLTGDHPETAQAIALEIGLASKENLNVISAETVFADFQEKDYFERIDLLRSVHVVARCTPQQKLQIVKALKKAGELVAVTGDGVNDAPALKSADIGIAMGQRGSQSAKEVSAIILSDDNFRTIVEAIKEGKQLFFNLKQSFFYLLLFHIPFVLTASFLPLFGYPIVYLPVHIVFLELIIHPSAILSFQSLTFTKNNQYLKSGQFFSFQQTLTVLITGILVTILMSYIYISELNSSGDIVAARTKIIFSLLLWSSLLIAGLSRLKTLSARVIIVMTLLIFLLVNQLKVIAIVLDLKSN